MNEEKKEEIKEIIADVLEIELEELKLTASFKDDYGADSMRAIEILASLERTLGIKIPKEEISTMTNLENVYKVISSLS